VKPAVVICLGATAAQALLGKDFRITRDRGKPIASELAPVVFATVHPSSVLRAPDPETREIAERDFMNDIKKVGRYLREH
jgi:DNA polymerase